MQFSKVIPALFVAVAMANPAPAPLTGGTPATGDCNGGKGSTVCCVGLLDLVGCVVGICSIGGGNALCCDTDQNGLINISIISCLGL